MRQKVDKERSQEGCAPLANPRHFLACPLRKFGPSPIPLRLCNPPVGVPSGTAEDGDSASRYFLRPKLSRDLPTTADATPLRTGLLLENRDRRSRAPPPPPRRAQLRCCSAGYGASPKKNLARRSLTARRDANASAVRAPTKVEITPAKHPTGAPRRRCLPARESSSESPPAGNATSTDELRRPARGGGGARDPTGRNFVTG